MPGKVLLTGASGYVGGRLLRLLSDRSIPVRCLARHPEFLSAHVTETVEVVRGDVLDRESLISILTDPRDALSKQYQRLFEMDGVHLEFSTEALEAVADEAILRGTGARGLRAIMEEVLLPAMYEVPGRDDVERVVVNAETVRENVYPTIVPRPPKRTPREKSA